MFVAIHSEMIQVTKVNMTILPVSK